MKPAPTLTDVVNILSIMQQDITSLKQGQAKLENGQASLVQNDAIMHIKMSRFEASQMRMEAAQETFSVRLGSVENEIFAIHSDFNEIYSKI